MADEASDPERERQKRNEHFAPYKVSPNVMDGFGAAAEDAQQVIIEVNLDHIDGIQTARRALEAAALQAGGIVARIHSRYFVFAKLTKTQLQELIGADAKRAALNPRNALIHKVWPDKPLEPFAGGPLRTIKADACSRSFGGEGRGIVWVVMDSGIEAEHPHFRTHATLGRPELDSSAKPEDVWIWKQHESFLSDPDGSDALSDEFGHGTHVAGIIAGVTPRVDKARNRRRAGSGADSVVAAYALVHRRQDDAVRIQQNPLYEPLSGVAPRCKLISMKVLDAGGKGNESALLAALDRVAEINGDGRRMLIHGVNISIGYNFNPEWFAAGQTPVCVAVNRLAKTGVVVVAAAGNAGSAVLATEKAGMRRVGLDQSIGDPGNAELAITVGSTHAEAPHTYGVSYFSSRGPTADGRDKPDLVAPGERILSCASTKAVERALNDAQFEGNGVLVEADTAYYRDETGTSMAAPHVSGAIAVFLSIHNEFIGQPERVKQVFLASATDLKRKREYQGAGLVDLLRAVQSV